MAAIAAAFGALFAVDTEATYASGNSTYLSTLLAATLSVVLFLLVAYAMKKSGKRHLSELFSYAFGKSIGVAVSCVVSLALVYAGAIPLIRIVLILCRFIFADVSVASVAVYFLVCIVVLSAAGLETIGRTARLFFFITFLSILLAFFIASPDFDAFHLYPLLGNGLPSVLWQGLRGTERFLPALVALLVLGVGVQGVDVAASQGKKAVLFSGAFAAGAQLCLGMTYSYDELAQMHSPMYRITMTVRMGASSLRADKLLLFIWTMGGIIGSAFYTYAAALLFSKSCKIKDVRPPAVTFGMLSGVLILLGNRNISWMQNGAAFLWNWLFVFFMAPVVLATVITLLKRGATK